MANDHRHAAYSDLEPLSRNDAICADVDDPNPAAAFEVMKPILEMAKADLAERYEERIGAMESLLSEISGHIERGNLSDADKRKVEGAIAKRRNKKRED